MKGVIAGINPDATVIDITHQIPPQDIALGAFVLERSVRYFPPSTVHVAVVDPGVRTARRAVVRKAGGQLFVGPANGLLTLAAPRGPAFELDRPEYFLPSVSQTFHGRDVFAPVAAHLSLGTPASAIGRPVTRLVELRAPRVKRTETTVTGVVLTA